MNPAIFSKKEIWFSEIEINGIDRPSVGPRRCRPYSKMALEKKL